MIDLSSRPNAAAMPTVGPQSLKPTQVDCATEGDGAQTFMFGDVLANVVQQPQAKDWEKDDRTSSGGSDEACASTGVIPVGLTEPIPRIDLPLASTIVAGNVTVGSCIISALTPQGITHQSGQSKSDETGSTTSVKNLDGFFLKNSPISKPASPSDISKVIVSPPVLARRLTAANPEKDGVAASKGGTFTDKADKLILAGVASQSSVASPERDETTLKSSVTTTLAAPIHVTSLETHLPAMILRLADDPGALPMNIEATTGSAPKAPPPDVMRIKILTFDVQPAGLGPLTVRMRMRGEQVDIAIEVRSEDMRSMLTQTRDSMVEALAKHGLRLEPPDIRLTTAFPAIGPGSAMNEQNAHTGAGGFTPNQGHTHHEERSANARHRTPVDENTRKADDGPSDAYAGSGIYL